MKLFWCDLHANIHSEQMIQEIWLIFQMKNMIK